MIIVEDCTFYLAKPMMVQDGASVLFERCHFYTPGPTPEQLREQARRDAAIGIELQELAAANSCDELAE